MGGQKQEGHLVPFHNLQQIVYREGAMCDDSAATIEQAGEQHVRAGDPVKGTEREDDGVARVRVGAAKERKSEWSSGKSEASTYFLQLQIRLRCERVTPLGMPVVPEEQTMKAVWSPFSLGQGTYLGKAENERSKVHKAG